jgi:superoxide reductase
MHVFICQVCGHIEFNTAPDNCPVCGAPKSKFQQNDNVFEDSAANSPEGAVKHVPVVTVVADCKLIPEQPCIDILVRVGETLHPMEEKHFISFLDLYVDNKYVSRLFLSPDMYPGAVFHLKTTGSKVAVVEMCNLHGHWINEAGL